MPFGTLHMRREQGKSPSMAATIFVLIQCTNLLVWFVLLRSPTYMHIVCVVVVIAVVVCVCACMHVWCLHACVVLACMHMQRVHTMMHIRSLSCAVVC